MSRPTAGGLLTQSRDRTSVSIKPAALIVGLVGKRICWRESAITRSAGAPTLAAFLRTVRN